MARVFIGLGSNIAPEENVRAAVHALRHRVHVVSISTVYITEPIGLREQPPFYNAVVEVETDVPPLDLKYGVLRCIEDELGRRRTADRNSPRTIDLDILIYDDLTLTGDDLQIPDPQIRERAFLAVPLYELAPDLRLPGSDLSIREIAANLNDQHMEPLFAYTELLRRDTGL
jgi:2-amino-4-hydroxy-6-hydroxymethyldihydropteridine diphosphokinase